MTNRIDAADPTAMPFIILLVALIVAGIAFLWARHVTRKRNRCLDKPRPDSRSSIEYSRPHMPERKK